jgi:hypothetical protein
MEVVTLPVATYAKIGRIATAWAKLEFSVDLMNGVIFGWHKARSYEKRIPLALESKLKFMRRAANRISGLSPYRDLMVSITTEALEFKRGRHTLAHGVPRAYDASAGVTYASLVNLNDNLAWDERTLSEEFLSEFAAFSEALSDKAFTLCRGFVDEWIEQSHDPDGKLPGG